MIQDRLRPLGVGEAVPRLALPAVNREGRVWLDEFRGPRGALIGLFRGLHCPFCRRQLAQLTGAQPMLQAAGVETLAVVNTPLGRARLYFRHRPTPVTLLADPDCQAHRAFGVPRIGFIEPDSGVSSAWPTRTRMEEFLRVRINPTGELAAPLQPMEANDALNLSEGFTLTAEDQQVFTAHGTQLSGHFLVDRTGIVRWAQTEASDTPDDLCKFPSPADLVARAGRLLEPVAS